MKAQTHDVIVLWRIDPLLKGDSEQRPLLRNARNNRTTGSCKTFLKQQLGKDTSKTERLWSMPRAYLDNCRYKGVEGSAAECQPAGNGSGRISIVKIRYQETSSERTTEEQPLLRAVTK
jgi:hypothetical protein